MYIALSPEEVLWTTKKMKKYRLPLVSLHKKAYVMYRGTTRTLRIILLFHEGRGRYFSPNLPCPFPLAFLLFGGVGQMLPNGIDRGPLRFQSLLADAGSQVRHRALQDLGLSHLDGFVQDS